MKKKFYQKKWFKIFIGLFIVLGFIGAIGGEDESDTGTSGASSAVAETETKTAKDNKKKDPIVPHNIGDTFTSKDFVVRVNSHEVSKTIGGEYLSTEASGTFVILEVTIKNEANKEKFLSSSDFKLIKGDVEYRASTDAMIYFSEETLSFEAINPGVEKTGKIGFDIPEDVAHGDGLQLLFKNDRNNIVNL